MGKVMSLRYKSFGPRPSWPQNIRLSKRTEISSRVGSAATRCGQDGRGSNGNTNEMDITVVSFWRDF
jgi:hypothetical protein